MKDRLRQAQIPTGFEEEDGELEEESEEEEDEEMDVGESYDPRSAVARKV